MTSINGSMPIAVTINNSHMHVDPKEVKGGNRPADVVGVTINNSHRPAGPDLGAPNGGDLFEKPKTNFFSDFAGGARILSRGACATTEEPVGEPVGEEAERAAMTTPDGEYLGTEGATDSQELATQDQQPPENPAGSAERRDGRTAGAGQMPIPPPGTAGPSGTPSGGDVDPMPQAGLSAGFGQPEFMGSILQGPLTAGRTDPGRPGGNVGPSAAPALGTYTAASGVTGTADISTSNPPPVDGRRI